MKDDIAKRLRNHVRGRLPGSEPALRNGAWDMMLEAADAIDRLRSALMMTFVGALFGIVALGALVFYVAAHPLIGG